MQENFTNYDGTSSTAPTGWYISSNANYGSTQYSGNSGPNSYKFSTDNATIVTPEFENADSVYFWIKGAGIDSLSNLDIQESSDSINWTPIANIDAINTTSSSGTMWGYAVQSTSKYLSFSYSKSVGNLAFDDFRIVRSQNQDPPLFPADTAVAGGKIKVYFNRPVDTTVATNVNALCIGNKMLDTIVAYINRAKYSIDIAEYNYLKPDMEKIGNAVNNAYSRGVDIRWIYNEGSSNTGLSILNDNINTLGRTHPNGLMHNKFVIIDAHSSNLEDAIVFTGSINWGWMHMDEDVNNVTIFQDSSMADAYTQEFNQMWGSSSLTPNLNQSKFGDQKATVLNNHNFDVGGTNVELYFSPSDPVNQSIKNSINTADTDLYFGVFSFTRQDIANTIKDKINSGIFSSGIMGSGSINYNAYAVLEPIMNDHLQINIGNPTYHNKMGIIDPSDSLSDPQVITGSYNWSTSAENKNDENTVIIHSPIVANMYYQSFHHQFNALGGTLGGTEHTKNDFNATIYPAPFKEKCTIELNLEKASKTTVKAYNIQSKETERLVDNLHYKEGNHTIQFAPKNNGVYIIFIEIGNQVYSYKTIKLAN